MMIAEEVIDDIPPIMMMDYEDTLDFSSSWPERNWPITKVNFGPFGGVGDLQENAVIRLLHNLTPPQHTDDSDEKIHLGLHFYGDHEFKYFCKSAPLLAEMLKLILILMQSTTLIHRLEVNNWGGKHNTIIDHFDFFVQSLLVGLPPPQDENKKYKGEEITTKHYEYVNMNHNADDIVLPMQFECANRLANAIRMRTSNSNNNSTNNNTIERFSLTDTFCTAKAFQSVWNALLHSNGNDTTTTTTTTTGGIQDLKLVIGFSLENNNVTDGNINDIYSFSNLSNNTTLRRLDLRFDFHLYNHSSPVSTIMGREMTTIFDSIKYNRTLEKLHLNLYHGVLPKHERMLFTEMLHINSSLVDVKIFNGYNYHLCKEITRETTINRIWKRYMKIKREEKKRTALVRNAVATALMIRKDTNSSSNNNTPTNVATATATAADGDGDGDGDSNNIEVRRRLKQQQEKKKKIEEEKKMMKKKKEMLFYLKTFHKPLMRNELIFSYLTENADMYNVH